MHKPYNINELIAEVLAEKVLVLFYNYDLKLKELKEISGNRFRKSREVFRSIYKSGKECSEIAIYTLPKDKSETSIGNKRMTTNLDQIHVALQFEDIIGQKIEHLRSIHNTVVGELLVNINSERQKNRLENFKVIQKIAEISAAQIITLKTEFCSAFSIINTNKETIETYLRDCLNLLSKVQDSPMASSEYGKIYELIIGIINCIKSYQSGGEEETLFTSITNEIVASFESFSSELVIKFGPDALQVEKEALKQIQEMYTMQSERKVHQLTVQEDITENVENNESAIELF